MKNKNKFKVGDIIESIHDGYWCQNKRDIDLIKANKNGRNHHVGNASAYMHSFSPYVVIGITSKGGLRLGGFTLAVSPKDVRLSSLRLEKDREYLLDAVWWNATMRSGHTPFVSK